MKRSPGLVPLSREHHGALSLARRIQTEAEDASSLIAHVRAATAGLLVHFEQEEALFLPVMDHAHPALGRRLRDEHLHLRAFLRCIGEGQQGSLSDFAGLLVQHVRFEERELFPVFESLPDQS